MSFYPFSVTIPVYVIFTAVGILLTALRFWTRVALTRQHLGADDWFIAGGVVILMACTALQCLNALHGTGGEAVSTEDAVERAVTAHKINFIMVVIEKPAFGAIKLSLLFFYRRIFTVRRSFRLANNILIVIIILWTVAFVLSDLLICGTKLSLSFDANQKLAAAHCGDKGLMLLLFAITSFVTDVSVLIVPLFYIRGLQMPKQQKWGAGLIFLLGLMSTVACILRMIFLCIAYPMGRMSWGYEAKPKDKTPLVLQVFNPTFWVMIEMCLGTWAANLPPLGPLLHSIGIRACLSRAYRRFSSAYLSGNHDREKPTAPEAETGVLNRENEWPNSFVPVPTHPEPAGPEDMV
ncbi:unnamed protein product [Clonostachys byssicola]|uniref:Rhodopsin domain-containing protein n=1 Tax=Clonostachys byssicola TaxID=160290 RepID=A0A9N9UBT6_9HYPO|nr:unnamed protein product [Clonostachys byssicola]